jgi:hypothetical protein
VKNNKVGNKKTQQKVMKEYLESGGKESETQKKQNELVKPNDKEWHQFQKDRREERKDKNLKKIKKMKVKMVTKK